MTEEIERLTKEVNRMTRKLIVYKWFYLMAILVECVMIGYSISEAVRLKESLGFLLLTLLTLVLWVMNLRLSVNLHNKYSETLEESRANKANLDQLTQKVQNHQDQPTHEQQETVPPGPPARD